MRTACTACHGVTLWSVWSGPPLPARPSLPREGRSPCAHRVHGIPIVPAACLALLWRCIRPSLPRGGAPAPRPGMQLSLWSHPQNPYGRRDGQESKGKWTGREGLAGPGKETVQSPLPEQLDCSETPNPYWGPISTFHPGTDAMPTGHRPRPNPRGGGAVLDPPHLGLIIGSNCAAGQRKFPHVPSFCGGCCRQPGHQPGETLSKASQRG